jgi:hypothetical protein
VKRTNADLEALGLSPELVALVGPDGPAYGTYRQWCAADCPVFAPGQNPRAALVEVLDAIRARRYPNVPPGSHPTTSIKTLQELCLGYIVALEHVAPETREALDAIRSNDIPRAERTAVDWAAADFPNATPVPKSKSFDIPPGWEHSEEGGLWTKGGVTVDARALPLSVSGPGSDGFTLVRRWPSMDFLEEAFAAAAGLLAPPTAPAESFPPVTPTKGGKWGPKIKAPSKCPVDRGETVKRGYNNGPHVVHEGRAGGAVWAEAPCPWFVTWFRRSATLPLEQYWTDINGQRLEAY